MKKIAPGNLRMNQLEPYFIMKKFRSIWNIFYNILGFLQPAIHYKI